MRDKEGEEGREEEEGTRDGDAEAAAAAAAWAPGVAGTHAAAATSERCCLPGKLINKAGCPVARLVGIRLQISLAGLEDILC